MPTIVVHAPAKINLFLDVVGVLENGYHTLDMVMQAIDLCDSITMRWGDDDASRVGKEGVSILLTCDDVAIPTDERNTAYQAVQAFYEQVALRWGQDILPQRIEISIEKHIPEQAGLGGSSADAAGVLCGLSTFLPQGTRSGGLGSTEMLSLAQSIGADVPFCLIGGTAQVGGIGEVMSALPPLPEMDLLIVKPVSGISTKKAFVAYDALSPSGERGENLVTANKEALLAGMATGSLARMGEHLYNALEQVCPLAEVTQIKDVLRRFGALGAQMSGSGSAVFAMFPPDGEEILMAADFLRRTHPTAIICHPLCHGATVIEKKI